MPDQLVAEYISTIYKYRGLLPFDKSESLSRRDIANWSDEALAKYFVYVLRREQKICKILEESKQKYLNTEIELSDSLEQYLVDTYEIDNGPDEEPTLDYPIYEQTFIEVLKLLFLISSYFLKITIRTLS